MTAPLTDFHIHIQPWSMMHEGPRETLTARLGDEVRKVMEDPAAALRLLDREEIDRAVLINYVAPRVMGFHDGVNRWILDYTREARDRLLPCGGIDLLDDPAAGDTVRRLADEGLRLLKLHPPHALVHADAYRRGPAGAWEGFPEDRRRRAAANTRAVYEAAQEVGLPVMVHTGTSVFPGARNRFADPLDCDEVAVDFPDLRLVLAHAGRPFWCERAVFLARRHPNLHLDLSGIPPHRLPHYLPDLERIAAKCLWGTDWPAMGVPGMRANLDALTDLGYPRATLEALTRTNPAALLQGRSSASSP